MMVTTMTIAAMMTTPLVAAIPGTIPADVGSDVVVYETKLQVNKDLHMCIKYVVWPSTHGYKLRATTGDCLAVNVDG